MPLYRSGFSCTPETWDRPIGGSPARWRSVGSGCPSWPPSRPSTRVLLITGFDHVVPLTRTVAAAVEKLGGGAPAAPA